MAARFGSFVTTIECCAFVRGVVRRVAPIIALLVALSPALAEVRTIDPSGEATKVDFGYTSEDGVGYNPNNNISASSSLFARVLTWAGLNIWFVMLRDQIQMDTTDYQMTTSFSDGTTLYLVNLTASRRAADGCRSGSSSDEVRCEWEQDLLALGLTNPNSRSAVSRDVNEANSFSGPGFPRIVLGRMSAGELKILSQFLQTFAQTAFARDSECCDASLVDVSLVPPELETGLLGGVVSPSGGPYDDPATSVGPSREPPVGLALLPEPPIPAQILETSGPMSIPELPVPVMLLVGAGALTLFMRKRLAARDCPAAREAGWDENTDGARATVKD